MAVKTKQPIRTSGEEERTTIAAVSWHRGTLVVGITALAATLHLLGHSTRPLWLDEACTYWTTKAPFLEILLHGARTDGTPPLYFLLVKSVVQLLGTSEFALRLVSLLAATALVPACYGVTRRLSNSRSALFAALFAAVTPLVQYYSVEARTYALLQLESVACVAAALAVLESPGRGRPWVLLVLALASELWTHAYGAFLVAAVPLGALLAADRDRLRVVRATVSATLAAFLLGIPPLVSVWMHADNGVADWIAEYWQGLPPSMALPTTLELFGVGARFPPYLPSSGISSAHPIIGGALTVVLVTCALFLRNRTSGQAQVRAEKRGLVLLFTLLLVPLLAAWSFSFLRQPVYLPGRYDTIVLPIFLMVTAIGLDRLFTASRSAGWCCLAVGLSLAGNWYWGILATSEYVDTAERLAAAHLSQAAAPMDPVVVVGFRRAVFEYYLDRAGRSLDLSSFPSEQAEHPAWYREDRILAHRESLRADAAAIANRMKSAALDSKRVWIMPSTSPSEVDEVLREALAQDFVPDVSRSRADIGVVCLALRDRPGPSPAR